MEFKLALIAVKDVNLSRKFYEDLFSQEVELDLGWNVTFKGSFAIQQNIVWLADLPHDSVVVKSHNMELYFEVEDFDEFIRRLERYSEIEYVHPPKKHEWQQRVVRIYDPDHHMIEVGESMAVIARRCQAEGYTLEETARMIQHPVEFVQRAWSTP